MSMPRTAIAVALAFAAAGLTLVAAPAPAAAHPCDHPGTHAYKLLGCARKHAVVVDGGVAVGAGGVAIAIGGGFAVEAVAPAPPPPPVVYVAPEPPPVADAPYVEPPPAPAASGCCCCGAPREPDWGPPAAPVVETAPPPAPVPVVLAPVAVERPLRYGFGAHGSFAGVLDESYSFTGIGLNLRLWPSHWLQLDLGSEFLGGLKGGEVKRLDVLPMSSLVLRLFPSWRVGVYGLAGLGASVVGVTGGDWHAAPAIQLGTGVELRLARRFGITADLRWIHALNGGTATTTSTEPACVMRPEDPRCVVVAAPTADSDRIALTVGAVLYF